MEFVVLGQHINLASVLIPAILPLHIFVPIIHKHHLLIRNIILQLHTCGGLLDLEYNINGQDGMVIGLAEMLGSECLVHHREQVR